LRQDKDLRLWELYQSSINNYKGATLLIPGEEVSVLNSKNKVVHLCGLGLSEYISGTLDGARKNIYHQRQFTIAEAVDDINRQGGVSFAAHPGAKAGFFQSVFLKRGVWGADDFRGGLGGVQAANSGFFDSWLRGKNMWVSALQKGLRVPILAGSDAHGDFNRYRAVGVPFLQIREGAERHMGFARTGVYGKRLDVKGIIDGIRDAAAFVTNGPFITICDSRRPDISLVSSKTVTDAANLAARVCSAKEFGALGTVKVITGRQGGAGETAVINQKLPPDTYDISIPIPASALPENCYLRAEAYGKTPRGLTTTAATSACFF
jgi:hypothetical protein